MNQPDRARIENILGNFQPKRKAAFEPLQPWKELIQGLCAKSASHDDIVEILKQVKRTYFNLRQPCPVPLPFSPEQGIYLFCLRAGKSKTLRKHLFTDATPAVSARVNEGIARRTTLLAQANTEPGRQNVAIQGNRAHFASALLTALNGQSYCIHNLCHSRLRSRPEVALNLCNVRHGCF